MSPNSSSNPIITIGITVTLTMVTFVAIRYCLHHRKERKESGRVDDTGNETSAVSARNAGNESYRLAKASKWLTEEARSAPEARVE